MTNLDEVQWRATEWIQMNGLRTDNVLDYFAQSPFYDRSSNNQVLKMQSQFNVNLHGRGDLYKELQNMKGIEFVVALERPPTLWIIRKQNRLSQQEVRLMATYFVVNENIFMAPSVYGIITSRLLSTTLALSESLSKASSLPTFSPSQGYSYADEETQQQTSSAGPPSKETRTPAETPQTPSTNTLSSAPIVDEKAMERALACALSANTVYLDDTDFKKT